jgi:hypothetical protein
MASKTKVCAVVGMLCESYRQKSTAALYRGYEIALEDISDAALDMAATQALRSDAEWMPRPGQLRAMAIGGTGGGFDTRADVAWLEFDRAVGSHGGDHSVSFADGLINATVRLLGGWVWCCERVGDDYGVWLRRNFRETYTRLCNERVAADLCAPLSGRLARDNSQFPNDVLAHFGQRVNVGQVCHVPTSQPVIVGPSSPLPRIAFADRPALELKRAGADRRELTETNR